VTTDVTEAPQVEALAYQALQAFGRIDVWINNVGTGVFGPSHEGILVKLFRHAQLRLGRRLSWSGIIQGGALVSAGSPCEPHIRRDTVPTTVPHSGRESSRRAAPLYKTARVCQAEQRRRSLGSVGPNCPAAQAYVRPIRSKAS
jgi:hypothetical protein